MCVYDLSSSFQNPESTEIEKTPDRDEERRTDRTICVFVGLLRKNTNEDNTAQHTHKRPSVLNSGVVVYLK